MIVYGRNVAKEYLKNPKKIEKIILQDGFDDKSILSLMENHLPQTHKAFVSQRQALFFDSQTKTIVKTKKKSTAMFVIVFFMQNSILTHEKAYFIDVLF